MPLFDNESRILQIETEKTEIFRHMENPLIRQPFTEDFARRFSWSTNAIEGNTLSLEETIAVIDYDEVRSNHTYSEYTDAKNAYHAIQNMLIPFAKTVIDEAWIKRLYPAYAGRVQGNLGVYWKSVGSGILSAGSAGRSSTYEKLDQRSGHRGGDSERDF